MLEIFPETSFLGFSYNAPGQRRELASILRDRCLELPGTGSPADQLESALQDPGAVGRDRNPHFTASCILFDKEFCRVGLLLHRKRGEWFYPGGHCDGDWNWFGAALRECREEMGSTHISVATNEGDLWLPRLPGAAAALKDGFGSFVLPRVLVLHNALDHQHIDCVYAFVTGDDGFHVALDEAAEARWFGLSEVLDGSHGENRLSGVTAQVIGAVAATMGSSSSVEV